MIRRAGTVGRTVWLPAALLLGLLAWCFQEVLFDGRLLSYRDSLQFYYPLFDYIQQEWEAGRPPLWDPYTNGGEPLLASPTSSVLYPLKGLFWLPVSYWARYHLYVLLHVLLAAAGCGWVARRWGAGLPAATLAAVSYGFCGNVLNGTSNIVFLCGAAWLPWALGCGERLVTERSWRRLPAFAAVLALMVLAGDPEMGYLAGGLVALLALLDWGLPDRGSGEHRAGPARPPDDRPPRRWLLLAGSAAAAVWLSLVQVWPAWEVSRISSRSQRDVPFSLYDIPGFLVRRHELPPRFDTGQPSFWYDGFIGNPPPPGRHGTAMYDFSLQPWRLAELIWPNAGGARLSGTNAWSELFRVRENVWAPTQYLGLWPLLLALGAMRWRRATPRIRWLSLMAILMLLGSFGSYGPGRLYRGMFPESEFATRPATITGGVGGVYWLMTLLLPGFSGFRYPSKLMVPASCALCLLAADGFDRLLAAPRRRLCVGLWALGGASAAAGLALFARRESFLAWAAGPLSARAAAITPAEALHDFLWSLGQTAVIATLLAVVSRRLLTRRGSRPAGPGATARWTWAVVALTAVDLAIANRWQLVTTDRAEWEQIPTIVSVMRSQATAESRDGLRPPRFFDAARTALSSGRDPDFRAPQEERVWRDRALLAGKQHLPFHLGQMAVPGTLDLEAQRRWFRFTEVAPEVRIEPRRAFDVWGTNDFIVSDRRLEITQRADLALHRQWADGQRLTAGEIDPQGPALERVGTADPPGHAGFGPFPILQNSDAFPAAWIVHRIQPQTGLSEARRDALQSAMVFPPAGRPVFDFQREALVEDEGLVQRLGSFPVEWPIAADAAESCQITNYEPSFVEIRAGLAADGLLVLTDTFLSGWTATVSTNGGPAQSANILRTNHTMRGVQLPAGNHIVRFRYDPASLRIGGWLSGIGWCAMLIFAAAAAWRRSPMRPSAQDQPCSPSTPSASPAAV